MTRHTSHNRSRAHMLHAGGSRACGSNVATYLLIHHHEVSEPRQLHPHIHPHDVRVVLGKRAHLVMIPREHRGGPANRLAVQYSSISASVGSDRTSSRSGTPGRTFTSDSSVSVPAGSNGAIFAVGLYLTFSVSLPRSVALGPASSITNSARTARTAAQHATSDMHSADTADARV